MLTPDSQVKILDFGISYQVTTSMTELVGEHHQTGTWPYMAPEQLSTRYGRENNQVDIWGFGVTMYQLLTGKFPFANKDQIKDKNEKPYEMEGISRKARNIVMKCLEKDRKNRFRNMEEVLKALNAVTMRKVTTKIKVKKAPPMKWILIAASVIVLVLLSVFLFDKFMPKDDLAYENASDRNTIAGYRAYLDKYPKGSHITEAKNKIAQLEKMPVDVRKVAALASKGIKVYQTKKDLWEADYGDGIKMVYIPAGNFTMGSNYYKDEKPPHEVYLDGYWLGKTEVTVGQYKVFISDTGHEPLPASISKSSPADDHPVVYVSWHDADAYCKWLSTKKGIKFKLPTEAQWEKAARGTDQLKYPWGSREPDDTLANFGYKIDKTTMVGSYPAGASPYGLLDMAGNVWEWCYDWYKSDYYKNVPEKNPTGPESVTYRVLRGGSWLDYARGLCCSYRYGGWPSYRVVDVGFRLCHDN